MGNRTRSRSAVTVEVKGHTISYRFYLTVLPGGGRDEGYFQLNTYRSFVTVDAICNSRCHL